MATAQRHAVEDDSLRVAIQVPAFKEPEIGRVMDAIVAQQVPTDWVVAYQGWVTPAAEIPDEDETFMAVSDNDYFGVFEAPRGKLSARNAAHDYALEQGADAIVQWDADALPKNNRALEALVSPLQRSDVVASNGNPRPPMTNPFNVFVRGVQKAYQFFNPCFRGQFSALTAHAWRAAGPFETNLDQTEAHEVRREEEFRFLDRLKSVGTVHQAREAVVLEEPRRALYHVNRPFERFGRAVPTEYERDRGVETFDPPDDTEY